MADEAGGVALWRDAVPDDELDIAAIRAVPSATDATAEGADDPTAEGDSLNEGSLGEPGARAVPQYRRLVYLSMTGQSQV